MRFMCHFNRPLTHSPPLLVRFIMIDKWELIT